MTGLTGDVGDLHRPIGELGHFQLEETTHQVGMAAGHHDLCALWLVPHLEDQRLDPVAPLQTLKGNSLAPRQYRLGITEVEDDRSIVDLLNDSGDEIALPTLVDLINLLPLRFTKLELHHLLEGLGCYPAKCLTLGSVFPLVHHVAVFVKFLGVDLHFTRFGIDGDPGLFCRAGTSLVSRNKGVGEGIENRIYRYTPLSGEDLNGLHHRVELHGSPSVTRLGGLLPPEHCLCRYDV